MKTNTGHITEILYKQLAGEILTAAEKADLDQWVSSFAANRQVFEELQEVKGLDSYLQNIYNDEKTDKALELFEARHSFQSITESGNASNNPGPSTPNPFNGLSKSSETNQSESSETTQSTSSETTQSTSSENKQSKSSESTQSESSENKQSKSSESNQSKSSESTHSKSSETNQFRSSVLTTTQVDVGAPGSIYILPGRRRTWFRYAAAVVVLIGTAVAFLVSLDRQGSRFKRQLAVAPDILPGSQRAVLTLADGRTIMLDSAANGRLADQGGVQVLKQADGQIVYNGKSSSGQEMINTMSTPRGGQYRLTLPDGTNVWLNAVSSITYPANFTGKDRTVRVSGEVYMEVAPNRKKPFIVNVDGKSSVEVLGTSFNINSYDEHESIKTTLVDGSIRVANLNTLTAAKYDDQATALASQPNLRINHKAAPSVILSPGQQAIIEQLPDRPPLVQQANVDQVLAWKNGLFDIEGLSLQEFAFQLERWYDIRVVYEGPIREMIFEGRLSRDVKLSAVLNWFSDLGIGNRLEGRTLILETGI